MGEGEGAGVELVELLFWLVEELLLADGEGLGLDLEVALGEGEVFRDKLFVGDGEGEDFCLVDEVA
ncbi:hypothetical protein HYS91_04055 [Candidatus Daviesbacteria bacterium]|nr:hypothetical protein [Candidatus Daviesbacteria bacterium]